MGRRALFISGAVFLVLLLFTLRVMRTRDEGPARSFFALRQSIPDTLVVAYGPDTTVIVPGSSSAGWELIHPVRDAADDVAVNALLTRLQNLPVDRRRFPLSPEKLDTYGMRHPRGMVRVAYRGGLSADTLFLGGFTPSGDFDYVRSGSAPEVGLMEARLTRTYFLKSTLELRETTLLPFQESRAVHVLLTGPHGEPRAELGLDPDGAWRVRRPYPGPADARSLREYLLSLNHMHIARFGPREGWPPAAAGLDAPAGGVTVVAAGGDTVRARFGDLVPGDSTLCYATSSVRPDLLEVPAKYLDVVLGTVDMVRAKAPFGFGLERVDSVRIELAGGRSVVLPLGPGGTRDEDRTLLAGWVVLRAEGFAHAGGGELRTWGLAPPEGRLVWYGGGETLAEVEVGREESNRRALRVSSGLAARPDELLLLRAGSVTPLWNALQDRARAGGAP